MGGRCQAYTSFRHGCLRIATAPQNWQLQLSRAMSKVAIAVRLLEMRTQGALARAFWRTACS
jgi:hypothetical protein